ncbi:MAG: hypothetical protein IT164_02055 [Bryobacterales bacterium]|nr:hypothetical protein [Bryobacterales bacterium]
MAFCEAAKAAAARVRPWSRRATRNSEITVGLKRSQGSANSGNNETVRLQRRHRYRRTRITPSKSARITRHPEVGHLDVGAPADVAVFRLLEGEFGFADPDGGKVTGKRRLFCELTLKEGRVAWDWNARAAVDYKTLGPEHGTRPGEFIVLPPGAKR